MPRAPLVAVAGSVDSGKSTLVAILTHGAGGAPLLDNGRGSARMAVFRHKHEIESGRTSSISQQLLGYNAAGAGHVSGCCCSVHAGVCVRGPACLAMPLQPRSKVLFKQYIGVLDRTFDTDGSWSSPDLKTSTLLCMRGDGSTLRY